MLELNGMYIPGSKLDLMSQHFCGISQISVFSFQVILLCLGWPQSAVGVQGSGSSNVTCLSLQWSTEDQSLDINLMKRNLQDSEKMILMHEVVQSVTTVPSFTEVNARFSHLVINIVQSRDLLVRTIGLAAARSSALI
ncbi:hypothetical protein P7K49_004476 [Saguinus oedipus]|uniref:Uncharacterized protein n=1 Tax=Saguinus oedipus TaxID=9490 RepID=A0ABQ9W7J7_SAGOE|nr:hypothetical protein P7K49_004476 [Saguinus oedipus]